MAKEIEFHPLANRFPLLEGEQFAAFVRNMETNGYNASTKVIWLYEGMILDGRNTYRACQQLGINPNFRSYYNEYGSPWTFVKMMNLHRLHLTPSQWAMLAAEEHEKSKDSIVQVTASQTAEEFGISESTLHNAKRVLKSGTDSVKQLVREGKATADDAAKIVKQPKEVQDAAANKVATGEAGTLAEAAQGDSFEKADEPLPACKAGKVDDAGAVIPAHLMDVFSSSIFKRFKELLLELKSLSPAMLANSPWWVSDTDSRKKIDELIARANDCAPYAVCPACHGQKGGCKQCRTQGWVPAWRYDEIKMGES